MCAWMYGGGGVEKESDYEALAHVSREAEKSYDYLQAGDPGKLAVWLKNYKSVSNG